MELESTMTNVVRSPWPDEPPTKPDADPVPSRTMVFAARVRRLSELAAERLMCAPSDDDLSFAVGALDQIAKLAEGVLA
jgi:hypothetical protein